MKHNKVWAVVFVTGYTSEAEVELFFKEEDAMESFLKLRDENFVSDCIHHNVVPEGSTFKDVKNIPTDVLIKNDVYIDSDTDITWDNGEIYTRIYVEQIEIR